MVHGSLRNTAYNRHSNKTPLSKDIITRFEVKSKVTIKCHSSLLDIPVLEGVMYATFEAKEPRPELLMKPVALFRDPFRQGRHKMVLTEFYKTMDEPSGKYGYFVMSHLINSTLFKKP